MRITRKIRYNVVSGRILVLVGFLYALSFVPVVFSALWFEGLLTSSFTFYILMTALFFGLLVTAVHKSTIEYDSADLHFPVAFIADLSFRLQRSWSDIAAVGIEDESNDYNFDSLADEVRKRTLFIYFKSGGHVNLKLSDLDFAGLRHFVDQLAAKSDRGTCTPELLEMQEQLKSLKDASQSSERQANFTQFWEDELSEHMSTTNFVPLEPGHELQRGKFLIERNISSSGMSAVYLASDGQSQKVVVKESSIPLRCNAELKNKAREMFEREALLLYKLDHPQIAKVKDYFIEDGKDYLVLEYIRGQSLRQYVRMNGCPSEDTVLRWARQIAQSVLYLHQQNPPILHRDLTPDNFVIADNERISLIDFGAANEFISTATGTAVGKQCYVAPEQFKGRANQQSDIYSLGCTLFYLLTGHDPEPLSTSFPRNQNHDVSENLNQLVIDCTAMKLSQRLTSGEQLIERLDALSNSLKQATDSIKIESNLRRKLSA